MSDTNGGHDVRYDYAGVMSNHFRLTCYNPRCNTATLVEQPYMTAGVLAVKIREFLAAHPPQGGHVTDADRVGEPIPAAQLSNIG